MANDIPPLHVSRTAVGSTPQDEVHRNIPHQRDKRDRPHLLETTPLQRAAFRIAVTLTAAAAVQQVLLAIGLGGWLPGWQPWPYLLAAAPAWLIARPYWPRVLGSWPFWSKSVDLLRRVPVWAFAAAVLALATGVWAALQDDEPDAGWGVYRPIGLPALGRIALALHGDVGALRATTLVLALFTLSVTYLAASHWTTPRQAVVTMLLLLSGLGFLRRVPEFLNDIGSTGLLLIVVLLLIRAQEKAGSRALLIVPFVILAAFYLRYGVVGNLLAIAVAAVLVYGPRAWLVHRWHLIVAGATLFAGLVPHFLYAIHVTGSPLGVILYATEQAERDFIGDGLVYYLAIFPYRLAGDLGAVVMTAGLVVTWLALRRIRRARDELRGTPMRDNRRRAFLGTASLFIFVVLGIATDGEPRFVYLPVILLTTLGVQYIAEMTTHWAPQALLAIASLAGITIFGTTQVVAHGAMPGPTGLSHSTVPVARQLSSKGPCLLVTGYEPEVGWYSGCNAVTYTQYGQMTPPRNTKISFILFERGRLQPDAAGLQRLIGSQPHTSRTIQTDGPLGTSTVITLTPKVPRAPQ